jgi:fibro-slime domain-containing protein
MIKKMVLVSIITHHRFSLLMMTTLLLWGTIHYTATTVTAAAATTTTIPSTLFIPVTVRDFMHYQCTKGHSNATLASTCPNDQVIRDRVIRGEISGHPDFEQYCCGVTKNYANGFPITSNSGNILPIVLPNLSITPTGIPRPSRCNSDTTKVSYTCESPTSGPTQIITSNDSFSVWYEDDLVYNKRTAYKQRFVKTAVVDDLIKYEYNSATMDLVFPGDVFFDPIQENGLSGDVWPLAPFEVQGTPTVASRSYHFTVEMHTFFEYHGGEVISFVGDDDCWVYINDMLMIDLGGVHASVGASVNLSDFQAVLGLEVGNVYSLSLFNAERHTTQSNFRFSMLVFSPCNVIKAKDWTNSTTGVWMGIDFPFASTSDHFVGKGFSITNNEIQMPIDNVVLDSTSYIYSNSRQYLATGFYLITDFRYSGKGRGFAIVFQDSFVPSANDSSGNIVNTTDVTEFGIHNLKQSVAVVIDFCEDGVAICAQTSITVRYNQTFYGGTNGLDISTRAKFDSIVYQNWKDDGKTHHVEVMYYAKPDWLEVYVDNSLRLRHKNFNLSSVVNSDWMYVGIHHTSLSSSVNSLPSQFNISNFQLYRLRANISLELLPHPFVKQVIKANGIDTTITTVLMDTIIHGGEVIDYCNNTIKSEKSWGVVNAYIVSTDACLHALVFSNNPLDFDTCVVGNLTHYYNNNNNTSTITPRDGWTAPNTFVKHVNVINNNNGSYSLAPFANGVVGNFSLSVGIGMECVWNSDKLQFEKFRSDGDCQIVSIPTAFEFTSLGTYSPTTNNNTTLTNTTSFAPTFSVSSGIIYQSSGLSLISPFLSLLLLLLEMGVGRVGRG